MFGCGSCSPPKTKPGNSSREPSVGARPVAPELLGSGDNSSGSDDDDGVGFLSGSRGWDKKSSVRERVIAGLQEERKMFLAALEEALGNSERRLQANLLEQQANLLKRYAAVGSSNCRSNGEADCEFQPSVSADGWDVPPAPSIIGKSSAGGTRQHAYESHSDYVSNRRSILMDTVVQTRRECDLQPKKHAQQPVGRRKSGQAHQAVFCDADSMKEALRMNIMHRPYTVTDFYKKSGMWQKIAKSTAFEYVTYCVISLNAIWIAVDTDHNTSEALWQAHPIFIIAENSFAAFFLSELFIRFQAFEVKWKALSDRCFIFDLILVIVMVVETYLLPLFLAIMSAGAGGGSSDALLGNASMVRILRLFRLTRMLRMVRLLRAMPELMILIKGLGVAVRSVFFTLCLLIAIVYVFAVTLTQLARGTHIEDVYFSGIIVSMDTLFLQGTMPDFAGIVEQVGNEGIGFRIIILLYILLAGLVIMNMLVGVLVEAVSVVASVEKEALLVNWVKSRLQNFYKLIDLDGDSLINRHEFETLLSNPEASRALDEVGVDIIGLVDFVDLIFQDDTKLAFPDLMDVVLQLRGDNNATVKDIVNLRKLMLTEIGSLTLAEKPQEQEDSGHSRNCQAMFNVAVRSQHF